MVQEFLAARKKTRISKNLEGLQRNMQHSAFIDEGDFRVYFVFSAISRDVDAKVKECEKMNELFKRHDKGVPSSCIRLVSEISADVGYGDAASAFDGHILGLQRISLGPGRCFSERYCSAVWVVKYENQKGEIVFLCIRDGCYKVLSSRKDYHRLDTVVGIELPFVVTIGFFFLPFFFER